jgi:hypothetical protein
MRRRARRVSPVIPRPPPARMAMGDGSGAASGLSSTEMSSYSIWSGPVKYSGMSSWKSKRTV